MGTIRGQRGELRGGGRVAAVLGAWDLRGTAAEWTVTARLEAADAYLVARGCRELRLRLGRRTLRWRDVDVEVAGDAVTVRGSGEAE